ncbi:MAG: stage III sporulation protein AF [Oscillospiraceae bacterium]|nr:stage III sporulation protein AF [Oscillospiraceae bacterium]
MESLQTAVLCGCFAAIALSLAEGILPLEKFGKQIRLLTAVLLLSALLRPVLNLKDADFSGGTDSAAQQTEAITEQLRAAQESAVAESVCQALNQALAEKQVKCTVSSCALHIDGDRSISINEVVITGNVQTGTVYLREWLGAKVTIREGGGT